MSRRRKKKTETETVKKKRSRRKKSSRQDNGVIYFPTGSTMLNCALSDDPFKGYRDGRIYNIIGDSSAGKTILTYTGFAEVANDPFYDDYRLIIDQAEYGEDFDREKLFNKKFVDRIEPPNKKVNEDGEPVYSDTIQEFHMNVESALDDGRPFLYLLDSFDSITDEAEVEKTKTRLKKWKKGQKDDTGTYGTGKAKEASSILRQIRGRIKNTKSTILIISQVRDNINAMFGSKKTRSGGKALKFYSWAEIWLLLAKQIKSKETQVGVNTKIKFGKNRETGKLRTATFPIYYDLGVDDLRSNLNYLLEFDYIKKKKQTIVIPELDIEATMEKCLRHIEDHNLEDDVKKMVGKCWLDFEDSIAIKDRKKRFA